ncbi:DMT family transporter [Tistrella bauzanensis]|jgi:S-adenosylmethionine uptake transporter|uniref:DMT family transporter n=1 Tax=Tistrella arctica TaxID=3133430 RepID=A0ABU9YKI0_9PROT
MTAAADGPTGTVRDQRAVAAMLLAVAMLSSMDVVMKLLGGSHGVGQMVLMKSLASLPWIAVWWLIRPQAAVWRVRRPAIHLLRGVLLAIAGFGFFHAFTLLPLAEAYAILFTAPIAAVLLAWGLMGERPGRGTGIALAAGFAGVLVVAAPGLMVQGLDGPALGYLSAAIGTIGYAGMVVTTRTLAPSEGLGALSLSANLVAGLVALPFALIDWSPLSALQTGGYLLVSGLSVAGIGLISWALSRVEVHRVAPLEYTAFAWALAYDWLVWRVTPQATSLAGAALIVAACLWLEHRRAIEARRRRG